MKTLAEVVQIRRIYSMLASVCTAAVTLKLTDLPNLRKAPGVPEVMLEDSEMQVPFEVSAFHRQKGQ